MIARSILRRVAVMGGVPVAALVRRIDARVVGPRRRAWPARVGVVEVEIVIPAKRSRLEPRSIDENLYKDRNKVERYFNKLKQYRRVATHYEKTASSFAGFVYLASAMILLL